MVARVYLVGLLTSDAASYQTPGNFKINYKFLVCTLFRLFVKLADYTVIYMQMHMQSNHIEVQGYFLREIEKFRKNIV